MNCPSCRRDVHDGALECPFCGVVFAKWRPERPPASRSRADEPRSAPTWGDPEAEPDPADRRPVRIGPMLLLALLGAAVVVGGYWWVEIRPRMARVEGRARESPGEARTLETVPAPLRGFDLAAALEISPLGVASDGRVLLIADRKDPGGFLRVEPGEGGALRARRVLVTESSYGQSVSFRAITWNGESWIGYADEAWFREGAEGSVFTVHDPGTLEIRRMRQAPSGLGCLAWDGSSYWAGSRRNTRDSGEPAELLRLDRDLAVVGRFEPPGSGCQGLAWDGSRLWWLDVFDDAIVTLDLASGEPRVERREKLPFSYPSGLAWDGSRLWMTEYGENRLLRVDSGALAAWLAGRPLGEILAGEAAPAPPERPSPRPEGDEDVDALFAALRSDDWVAVAEAKRRLADLGVPARFDRHHEEFAAREPEGIEELEWRAEIRDGDLFVSWRFWFGPGLFEERAATGGAGAVSMPVFRRYTVTLTGGGLAQKIERVYDAEPGENARREERFASGLGPGRYQLDAFLHVQYVDAEGSNRILNASATTLTVEN